MDEMTSPLTLTALHKEHQAAGAKMVPYAGFEMPVSYAGLVIEHNAVREACGMFDVSHMGEFRVRGAQALDLIQHVTSNDASKLTPGKVQYSCMPNGQGGIVDDLLVYCIAEDEYMLVVNASNRLKDFQWIHDHNSFDAVVTDESDAWS
ncbi:MAG: glycine cleavage system aminomethyltransferase GcvT, partial [Flavobacteriales bacterium]